ncbi:wHTH domain-containing protein [Streptomyces bluensis]|uniref:wHTH domain-containing protein n=1 Tax=Streptomyces bluensis TaxID=33897 RepID=UPI00332E49A2
MTDPGGANGANSGAGNTISGGTVHGSAVQARDVASLVINQYGSAAPAAEPPSAHAWAREVANSPLWDRIPEGRDATASRDAARAIASVLAALHDEGERELTGDPGDPWWDRPFATRFHGETSQLVCAEGAADWDFQPAEVLLLTLTPFLSQTLWARTAAARVHVGPANLRSTRAAGDRADFEKFFDRGHERLVRRATLDLPERAGAESHIGWWLFHQWIDHGLRGTEDHWTAYTDLVERLPLPDASLTALFHKRRAGQLLYGLRLPLGEMCRPERLDRIEPAASVSGTGGIPQKVRVRRLALLLAIARARALDIPALPDDLVENLGIPYRVDLSELHETVAGAAWHADSGPMVLQAADCHHEAVVEALRRHVEQVDVLLYDIHRAARGDELLEPLRALPLRASAEGVEAALDDNDRPKFESYSKFRVDARRVQELLMGDQLYRSPGLAIRELYQNALDACRYRKARTDFLATRPGTSPDDWKGLIRFEQGVGPDGRPYLLCEDNGIGMGESELSRVFARAGTRFTDLTDVRNERANWEAVGINLYPVSRFGIGVLSYFMIADEIEVVTRRLGEDGATSEPCFKVAIYGPNHLFRIERSTERRYPGTTVRLYLRKEAPSCVTELVRLLGVSDVDVEVEHGARSAWWAAGAYRLKPGPGGDGSDRLTASGWQVPGPVPEGAVAPSVIWCESGGGVLVDGILTRPEQRRGVLADSQGIAGRYRRAAHSVLQGWLVNLTGDLVPKLSVDRLQILDDVSEDVERLLRTAARELVTSMDAQVTTEWISSLAETSPKVADIVTEALMATDLELELRDGKFFRPAEVGVLPWDSGIIGWATSADSRGFKGVPDHVVLWRLLAHGQAQRLVDLVPELGTVGRLLPALPSDSALLAPAGEWLEAGDWSKPGFVLWIAARLGTTPRRIALRATALGADVTALDHYPDDDPDPLDLSLLRRAGRLLRPDVSAPWRSTDAPVPLDHFLDAYVRHGLGIVETAARMTPYGFDVSLAAGLPDRPEKTDLVLLSTDGEGEGNWCAAEREVPPGHVLRASVRTGLPAADVCRTLRAYGLTVTDLPERSRPEDLLLLSTGLDGEPPWLKVGEEVPFGHVRRAAEASGQEVDDVIAALSDYGLRPRTAPHTELSEADRELLDALELEDVSPSLLDRLDFVDLWSAADVLGWSLATVTDRLRALGVAVPLDFPQEPDELDDALLSDHELKLWSERKMSGTDVSLAALLGTARGLRRPVKEIAARLESYGFRVPRHDHLDPGDLADDVMLLSYDLDSAAPWMEPEEPVSLSQLCAASAKLGISIPAAAVRFRRLGFDVPEVTGTIRAAMARLPRAQEA